MAELIKSAKTAGVMHEADHSQSVEKARSGDLKSRLDTYLSSFKTSVAKILSDLSHKPL